MNDMKEIETIKQQELFIDGIFRIIPTKFISYKLLTISYMSESKKNILFCTV